MKLMIHPDYRITDGISIETSQNLLRQGSVPEGMQIETLRIPGLENDPEIEAYLYLPPGVRENLPVIMDVHGGGFSSGDAKMDKNRDIHLAMHVPAIVVAINYRLAPEWRYPAALRDCRAAWQWIYESIARYGGDPTRMGLFGASAGGGLCAALAFYLRDHGGPAIALNALMVPALGIGTTLSKDQMRFGAPVLSDSKGRNIYRTYLGSLNGEYPSYYAVPNAAIDFIGLPPTLIIAGEYDPLREDAMYYARRLREADVPLELYQMPRVGHGFDMVADAPMTKWIWDGMAMSFRREFQILAEDERSECK